MSAEDAALLNFSESLADFGTWLVIIGVAGEGIEIGLKILRHKLKNECFLGWCNRHEFSIEIWGAIFWLMVVGGLTVEFSGNHEGKIILDRQNAELYEQGKSAEERAENATLLAAQANERTSKNELAAKQLEIQLNETKTQLANAEARLNESLTNLEMSVEPMNLGDEDSFMAALRPLAGIRVELRLVSNNRPARMTSELLSRLFLNAGWMILNNSNIDDIGEDGIVIGANGDAPSKEAAQHLLKILTERNVPAKITPFVFGVPTNSIIVAVCPRPAPVFVAMSSFSLALADSERNEVARMSNELNSVKAKLEDKRAQISKLQASRDQPQRPLTAVEIMLANEIISEKERDFLAVSDTADFMSMNIRVEQQRLGESSAS